MSSASAAPSWAETTVRWLASRYPQYVGGISIKKTFAQRLETALFRMCLDKVRLVTVEKKSEKEYQKHIKDAVNAWNELDHQRVTTWLDQGGYEHDLEEYEKNKSELDAARAKLIADEMAADEDSHVALHPSLRDPEKLPGGADLDEVLLEAERAENPEMGSW